MGFHRNFHGRYPARYPGEMDGANHVAGTIPEFGRLLAPVLSDLAPTDRPAFLARLERIAAGRYRQWATEAPQWSEVLLACAAAEDEIADRVMDCFPVDDATAASLDSRLPLATELYQSAFASLPVHEQLRIQAAAELQGANAWRSVSTLPGLSAHILSQLARCSELEERSSASVSDLLTGGPVPR